MVDKLRHPKDWSPISLFSELAISAELLRGVEDLQYEFATPIQRLAIPPALAGRDILASAPTGSGKSAAFGLPVLEALLRSPKSQDTALILAPTRELAQQITEHLRGLAKHTKLRIEPVYGGVGMRGQIQAFRRKSEVIVATPGRLLDLLRQGEARLDRVKYLVLDEADRMLDMGFLPPVKQIIAKLPNVRQTLFFSATLGTTVTALANELLHDPVRVNLAPAAIPVDTVTQSVYAVEQHKKTDLLVELLKDPKIYSALVFTRTKARADRLAAMLSRHNVGAERIHGDRTQAQRARALQAFKNGRYQVLVATDVAARGIDIVDLGHVINYDVPQEAADYIHRIGRTARAQKAGDAITFVSREEADLFSQIERSIGKRLDRAEHPLSDISLGSSLEKAPQARRRTFRRRRR
ncbi:MAG TPA: DEAD/DEAH box helicase [Candidatus Baltobacteraceae bacterium]|nr:DEAD/DEAH box helicase [Candidatus Baltobacteraceae bacterium]